MKHARIISIRIILVSILALQFETVSYTNCQSDLTGNSCLIEIPEIHELVFVVYALATLEDTSSNTIQRESDYYKEVIQTFGSFRNEKAVKKLAGAMRSGYDPLRMDACLYSLSDHNEILKSKTINNLSWGNKNTLRKFLPALEAFALKSNFKKFYNDHLAYYKSQIDLLRIQGQPESQWRWLTQKFNVDYASVTIVFSPLSYAQHSTNRIKDGSVEHVYIFVSGPFQFEDKIKTEQVQPQICRMLFTELDHNFVNPLSEKYKEKIEVVFRYTRNFGDIKKTLGYTQPLAMFNEYMTWSLFTIYARESFSLEDYLKAKTVLEKQMVESRGFFVFREFNNALLQGYDNLGQNKELVELFPTMISWSEQFISK